jgi:hypothetical protein
MGVQGFGDAPGDAVLVSDAHDERFLPASNPPAAAPVSAFLALSDATLTVPPRQSSPAILQPARFVLTKLSNSVPAMAMRSCCGLLKAARTMRHCPL